MNPKAHIWNGLKIIGQGHKWGNWGNLCKTQHNIETLFVSLEKPLWGLMSFIIWDYINMFEYFYWSLGLRQ